VVGPCLMTPFPTFGSTDVWLSEKQMLRKNKKPKNMNM